MARKKKETTVKPTSKEVPPPPVPKTSTQKKFIDAICSQEMVVVTGPAGTGKTFISACYAGWFYKKGLCNKIVLTRPTVGTGKGIGFFPGTLEEKMEPWVTPFISALQDYLGKGDVENLLRQGKIEIVPFEVVRGRTFNDAFVILDEAQNCTAAEVKAFVTRHGENCTTIINGDVSQSDLNGHGNGLSLITGMISRSKELQKYVSLINFTYKDIVRSDLCKAWVKEFDREGK